MSSDVQINRLVLCRKLSETKYPEFEFDAVPKNEDLLFYIYLEVKGDDAMPLRPRVTISDGIQTDLEFHHKHFTNRGGTAYVTYKVERDPSGQAWWFPKGQYTISAQVGEQVKEITLRVL